MESPFQNREVNDAQLAFNHKNTSQRFQLGARHSNNNKLVANRFYVGEFEMIAASDNINSRSDTETFLGYTSKSILPMATSSSTNRPHSNNRNVGIIPSNVPKINRTSSPTYSYTGTNRIAPTTSSITALQGQISIANMASGSVAKNNNDKSNSSSLNKTQEEFNISPSKLNAASELDTMTIQRQRHELQELNDMVQAHQKEIAVWEEDRERLRQSEHKCARLEGELKHRREQVKSLQTRIKIVESQEYSKSRALEDAQRKIQQVNEQANLSSQHCQDLEEKNETLSTSLRDLSTSVGHLQAREQELLTMFNLKENDLTEANKICNDLRKKFKKLEIMCEECTRSEKAARADLAQWRQQAAAAKEEVEKLRNEIEKQCISGDKAQAELSKNRQEVAVLQKELFLANERDKRKEQLIELQRSKQERADAELANLRQVYDRQQRDLSILRLNYQTSRDRASMLGTELTFDTSNIDNELNVSGRDDIFNSIHKASSPNMMGLEDNSKGKLNETYEGTEDAEDLEDGASSSFKEDNAIYGSLGSNAANENQDKSQTGEQSLLMSKMEQTLKESREIVENLQQRSIVPSNSIHEGKEQHSFTKNSQISTE
ncbi:Coiled-coil domain-containing protein 62 [Trichoplax sp. H2]|nr:Coiled-coil domain-containing protein 62 [Trichoplax sp. H2]|eukprot:RDD43013.1 Coiled-coil domain-containing protein 62 [Trichoplax sp. H2]